MKKSRFRVYGLFDQTSRPSAATVTISRDAGTFAVRPLRRRREYVLPLATVAQLVVRRLIACEVAERKRLKAESRKAGRLIGLSKGATA